MESSIGLGAPESHQVCGSRGSFDLATGCMSFQDMADVGAAFAAVRELLVEKGRLVISVLHPGTDTARRGWELDEEGRKLALKIDRYFDTGPRTVSWSMERLVSHWESPAWRRTLTEWSQVIGEAGFVMSGLNEPRPTQEQIARQPALETRRPPADLPHIRPNPRRTFLTPPA